MNLVFIKAAAERAVKTFAQTAIAQLGTGSVGITSLDWRVILSVSAMAAVASVLTSLASLSSVTPAVFPTAKVEAAVAEPAVPLSALPVEPATVTPVFEAPATPVAPVA